MNNLWNKFKRQKRQSSLKMGLKLNYERTYLTGF